MSRKNSKELIIKRRTYSSDIITNKDSRSLSIGSIGSIGSIESIVMDNEIITNVKTIPIPTPIIDKDNKKRIRDVYIDLEYTSHSPNPNNPSYLKKILKIGLSNKQK